MYKHSKTLIVQYFSFAATAPLKPPPHIAGGRLHCNISEITMKKRIAIDADEPNPMKTEKMKKKQNKNEKSSSDLIGENPKTEDSESRKREKAKSKKRKTVEPAEDDSTTSSELVEPPPTEISEKKIQKKAKMTTMQIGNEEEEERNEEKGNEEEDPNALKRFRISEPLRSELEKKGIKSLFPIQAMTFDSVLDGADLVGRARTGQGKTLAFLLPILESLVNGRTKTLRKTGYGRPPSVLVLLPTRELAAQVFAEFEAYGEVMGLSSCCLYGQTPYSGQQIKLKRGVDIVVGTPGRVKDHIERGNMDLGSLQFRVLDEADEMLNRGFVEDVELILGKVKDVTKVQTLLFSATLPDWIKQISSRFLKPDKKTVDLVTNQKVKASTNVRHIAIPCSTAAMPQLIPDIIRCYGSGGRTIVFTERRDSTSQLAGLLPGAMALHGEIQQSQREVTLAGFRSGKFMTLVATNVAARGLDINDVQLIIQCEPPNDVEDYIHRSGRTGRAGNKGVAVMLFDPTRHSISRTERESGVMFEVLTAPKPADIAKVAGQEAAETIAQISNSVIPAFKSAAQDLLNDSGLSAVELLAKALAKASGFTDIKERSILTCKEDHVTLLLESSRPIYSPMAALNVLGKFLPEEKVKAVQGLTLTDDGKGAVFDVAANDLDTYLSGQENAAGVTIEVLKKLPRLQEKDASRARRFGSGWRGGSRFGSRGGQYNPSFDRKPGGRFSNDSRRGRGRGRY